MGNRTSYDTAAHGSASFSESVTYSRPETTGTLRQLLGKGKPSSESSEQQLSSVVLPSGRSIECQSQDNGHDAVTIRSAEGQVVLAVTLTESGPILRFDTANLQLQSQGKISVDCDEYHVRASKRIVEQTRGDRIEQVGGDATVMVQGALNTQARETEIRSTRGDVQIKANDDVRLNGERVKLNC